MKCMRIINWQEETEGFKIAGYYKIITFIWCMMKFFESSSLFNFFDRLDGEDRFTDFNFLVCF